MESPVVVDKPPEYHGNAREHERGFPFDEEEGSGAWSELAARHPDIAARLRQRPATWARKRRPSSQDATEDFGESFSGFDRFPFDDIPPEFREHFPTHWNRRYSGRDEQPTAPAPQAAPASPQHSSAATQTEQPAAPHLPQYGLRNTVDLGQKSAADPSLVDADDRSPRSMSAPPDGYAHPRSPSMSAPERQEPADPPQANVRHIPIFVEGRDEPVINKSAHFGEPKPPQSQPHPHPPPYADREQYFDEGPAFHAPPNFSRAFGTPFNKGFRQGPQPFVQQKVYPQTAFARGASPQRSQSPKPQPDEHYVKVPVHHEHAAPRAEPQPRPQPQPQPQPQQKPAPQQPAAPKQPTSPPQPKPQPQQTPSANDPITQILSIQTDVLNLMSEVENFTGTKKDKRYLFLDEMLTRNLIKLDNIETEGKENIRQARKEAIKCIQKCIAVLEAKAEKGSNAAATQDVVMNENAEPADPATVNGAEVEMKDASEMAEPQSEDTHSAQSQQEIKDTKPQEEKAEAAETPAAQVAAEPQAADTRPEEKTPEQNAEHKDQEATDKKASPKKGGKNVKKRDKSKDNKEKDSNKDQTEKKETEAAMQVDAKGDAAAAMEVDGAASQ